MSSGSAVIPQAGVTVVDLRIPRKAEWVAVARLTMAAVANRLRCSIEDIEDLKLAVAEACTSCIQQPTASDQIAVTAEMDANELRLTVREHTEHAPAAAKEHDRAGEPAESELGIFLIRSLMDHVEYTIDPQAGLRLYMVKKLPG